MKHVIIIVIYILLFIYCLTFNINPSLAYIDYSVYRGKVILIGKNP